MLARLIKENSHEKAQKAQKAQRTTDDREQTTEDRRETNHEFTLIDTD
jgi:hypothetical protein